MGKYIIELKKGEIAYKTVDSNGTPMIQLLGPIPYFAPNIEQVREEAKEEGYRIGYDEGREAGVQQGLADAWEAARKIWKYDTTTLKAIFGEGIMRMDWFMKFTASEAIEKLKAYEQEQEEIIDPDKNKVEALANDIGIHKLYALVKEIRGE